MILGKFGGLTVARCCNIVNKNMTIAVGERKKQPLF